MLYLNRKQRKGNGVKRVYKETSSRSDSEEESSDEEITVIGDEIQNDEDLEKMSEEKVSAFNTTRRAMLYPRAAKTNAWRKQIIKQQKKSETRTLDNKTRKKSKGRQGKSRVSDSNAIEESSGKGATDEDLAIDVEAFVHHGPVMEDIDQVSASVSCPFCSALCKDNQHVIQHIKDCHDSGEITIIIPVMSPINILATSLRAFIEVFNRKATSFHKQSKLFYNNNNNNNNNNINNNNNNNKLIFYEEASNHLVVVFRRVLQKIKRLKTYIKSLKYRNDNFITKK